MKILDILIAITFAETTTKKTKKTTLIYPASNVTPKLISRIFVQTCVMKIAVEILSDITGGRNVACCGLKPCATHKYFYYPNIKTKIPSGS